MIHWGLTDNVIYAIINIMKSRMRTRAEAAEAHATERNHRILVLETENEILRQILAGLIAAVEDYMLHPTGIIVDRPEFGQAKSTNVNNTVNH